MTENTYITQMKGTITKFYNAMQEAKKKIDNNNSIYLPDIAAGENEKIKADLHTKERAAEAEINAIRDKAHEAVDRWKALSGKEIEDADLKLLSGAFNLTAEDLTDLIMKHKDNGTMIRAIGDYADAHKIVVMVPTPEAKKRAYNIAHDDAINMLGTIEANVSDFSPNYSGFSVEMMLSGFMDQVNMINNQTMSVLF